MKGSMAQFLKSKKRKRQVARFPFSFQESLFLGLSYRKIKSAKKVIKKNGDTVVGLGVKILDRCA